MELRKVQEYLVSRCTFAPATSRTSATFLSGVNNARPRLLAAIGTDGSRSAA